MKNDPFIVKVSELFREVGLRIELSLEARPYYPDKPFELADNLQVNIVLTNTGDTILVAGQVRGRVKLTCGRCQKIFSAPIKLDIEEQFARPGTIREINDEEVEVRLSDFIFKIEPDDTIDLKELIRQNILLYLPIKPLCSPSCPRVDKSVPEEADPRLADLKSIKKMLKEKK